MMHSLIALFLSVSLTAGFHDVAGHWGEPHLTMLIEAGIIVGDGRGNAMPDKPIERVEAEIMLSKTFGLFNRELAGLIPGDGAVIVREEAFSAIRAAFNIPVASLAFASKFDDFTDVSEWARGCILAMEADGKIAGKNGRIAPRDAVTRAEFAAMLAKSAGLFIEGDADFNQAELERAVIRSPGAAIKNLTVESLIIAHGAGNVTLEQCDIGVLLILGGGPVTLTGSYVTLLETNGAGVYYDEDSIIEQTVPLHIADIHMP
jgi:hypothetical protein